MLFCLSASGLSALTWEVWSPELGLTFQVNSQIGSSPAGKYPSVFRFTPGVSFFADWDGQPGKLFFRPGAWLSWNVEDVYQGIARPCDEAAAGHMKVGGIMLDAPFGYYLELGKVDISFQGGASLYLRIPLYTAQGGSGKPVEFWKAYYGAGQFLYLGAGVFAEFPAGSSTHMRAGVRVYQPLASFWTQAPPAHGLMIGALVSLDFNFPEEREKSGEELP